MERKIMEALSITAEVECRICKGKLNTILDLGCMYPSAFLRDDEEPIFQAPLALSKCEGCGLVQLKDTVDLDLMYRQYWYASSLNKSMVASLEDIVREIESRVYLSPHDVVVDIGANDGTLLGLYKNKELWTIAFEPALNLRPKINGNILVWIPDYFSKNAFQSHMRHPLHTEWASSKAKVVTAIAMFYDLPDPNAFVQDVRDIMTDDGIFVIQFTDLLSMIKASAFDNICHEHLEYYRLVDLWWLLKTNHMDIIDVSYNSVNGGSLRVTACKEGVYSISSRVSEAILQEQIFLKLNPIEKFAEQIQTTKEKVQWFLKDAKNKNMTVFLLGASTKGNTLLQICEVTNEQIPYAAEVNMDKFGLRTVGSNVRIISEEDALSQRPDYFLVPVWHFKESLLNNPKIKDYMELGGMLVFPLPEFHVVYLDQNKQYQEKRI